MPLLSVMATYLSVSAPYAVATLSVWAFGTVAQQHPTWGMVGAGDSTSPLALLVQHKADQGGY
jgi:hypothetical protein